MTLPNEIKAYSFDYELPLLKRKDEDAKKD